MTETFYVSILSFSLVIGVIALVISSKLSWVRKTIIMLMLSTAGIMCYRAISQMYGYPVLLQSSKKKATIVAFVANREENLIYLWIIEKPSNMPRSYSIPYSGDLHRKLMEAMRKSGGQPVTVDIGVLLDMKSSYKDGIKGVQIEESGPTGINIPPKQD